MFKIFPEFSKLTFSDREEYEKFIKDFPPTNDLAFASLMAMWSTLDTAKVAVLNGNLVISYWLPGADVHSGLALVGTNLVDESLCTICDYLRHDEQEARVVNVPQFVVDHVRYPEMFHFDIKAGDEDFVVALKRLAVLSGQPLYRRARIKKFIKDSGNLEIKSIDLSSKSQQKLLLDSTAEWPKKGLNNIGEFEQEGLEL